LLHDTSFCFVCCYLASGSKDGDALLRNIDAADILWRTKFRRHTETPDEELPTKILEHEYASYKQICRSIYTHDLILSIDKQGSNRIEFMSLYLHHAAAWCCSMT
jgi:hypothetical protein